MPSIAAHYYFGQETARLVKAGNPEMDQVIEQNKSAFDLGLQGPDLLFYFKPYTRNRITAMGSDMHWQPAANSIEPAVQKIREAGQDGKAMAYLLGYTCHFILDSSLHGEIAENAPDMRAHFSLEAEIDRQIIQWNYSPRPQAFKRHRFVQNGIKDIDFLKLIYPGVEMRELKKCMKGFVFYIKLLTCKNEMKKKLLENLEALIYKESPFTAMIVDKRANKAYRDLAEQLCKKMKTILPEGVIALENVYASVRYAEPLSGIFHKNFE